MLLELEVSEFAIIERLRLRLSPGFSALTGETGAGKSLLVDALGQRRGDRADTGMIRAGAESSLIEGIFDPDTRASAVERVLHAYGVEPGPELILRREIHSSGRSSARINGRAVPVRALAEVGTAMVDIHGQSENVSLKRESEHVDLLDKYAGLEPERERLAGLTGRLDEVLSELNRLRQNEAEIERRAALLAYQVEEIETARLVAGEEDQLLAERTRLANSEKLAVLADAAYEALHGGAAMASSALDRLGVALDAIGRLNDIDQSLADHYGKAGDAHAALTEIASELIDYRDRLEFEPDRQEEIETRLALLSDLERKYGPSIESVLDYARTASEELATLSSAEERIAQLTSERDALEQLIGALAAEVSQARRAGGEALAEAIEAEMAALGMAGSKFRVSLERRPDPSGVSVDGERVAFDAKGVDRVAFLVSTNPGEPLRPLARVASGGETSRLMLALKGILIAADRVPTLVFDEVDAGIGGRVGSVVGQRLWALSSEHQVLCVTHLPQVAAYADAHLRVWKQDDGDRTSAMAELVEGDERILELTGMLGSGSDATREAAAQLLQHSTEYKTGRAATP